ncbi:orotate phosphoribosyltransferase [Tenacibaculum holothuriorum]|uniref:Orotate phosphoribosyltransferase n=1 Tax=Tenacibaculum holothuriorum TaxID=1635173 RepID=A0A1Y2PD30_9FLAO|nr:orotate phosphoribosyltransferase [Tenacibaculum holothuriorum]OSY87921.1 orotate phosphoribosyltransferase [Tenacibaculum holothuriorum]
MNIEGNTVTVQKSAKDVFDFFTKLENFEQLMPESIQKFEVDGDSFIFGLKGMPEIRLVMKEKTEFSNVTLGAASSKLPFTLAADLQEISENETNVTLKFAGDFNPMMAMMVKKPLTSFINTLTENISKL